MTPRLERALAAFCRLETDSIVEAPASAIAAEVGVSTRALRSAVSDLAKLGELSREHRRGRGCVLRLVLRKPEAGSRKPEAGSRKPEAGSRKPEGTRAESLVSHEIHDSQVVPQSLEKSSSSVSSPEKPEGKAEGGRADARGGERLESAASRIEAAIAGLGRLVERVLERLESVMSVMSSLLGKLSPREAAPGPSAAAEAPRPSDKAWRPRAATPLWGPTDGEKRAVLERVGAILRSEPAKGPLKSVESQLRDVRCFEFLDVRAGMAHVELALARGHDVRTRRGSFWDATRLLSFVREELAVASLEVVDAELARLRRPVAVVLPAGDPVQEVYERQLREERAALMRARSEDHRPAEVANRIARDAYQ